MSKGNTTENDYIKFCLNNVFMPSYGSNIVLNLHTADPGGGGTASTYVADYTGYTAVNVSRDETGWTVTGASGANTAIVLFPKCTGVSDSQLVTHLSLSGTNGFFVYGALSSELLVTNNVQPQFPIAAINWTED